LHSPLSRPRAKGRDVYVYFDNDVKTHAPFDAMNLAHRLGLGPAAPEGPEPGTVKFVPLRTGWPGWAGSDRRLQKVETRRKTPAARATSGKKERNQKRTTQTSKT
jgi:hypothetical protein